MLVQRRYFLSLKTLQCNVQSSTMVSCPNINKSSYFVIETCEEKPHPVGGARPERLLMTGGARGFSGHGDIRPGGLSLQPGEHDRLPAGSQRPALGASLGETHGRLSAAGSWSGAPARRPTGESDTV